MLILQNFFDLFVYLHFKYTNRLFTRRNKTFVEQIHHVIPEININTLHVKAVLLNFPMSRPLMAHTHTHCSNVYRKTNSSLINIKYEIKSATCIRRILLLNLIALKSSVILRVTQFLFLDNRYYFLVAHV
jgi:hypothetical protein